MDRQIVQGQDTPVIELAFRSSSIENGNHVIRFSLRGDACEDFHIVTEERFGCDPTKDMTGPLLIYLFSAMSNTDKLAVRGGPVSQWLLDRIEDYQEYFVNARRRSMSINPNQLQIRVIPIDAEAKTFHPCQDPCRPLIANFSGGVDSCYGLWDLRQKRRPTMNVSMAMFVSGYGKGSANDTTWQHIKSGPEDLGYENTKLHIGLRQKGNPNSIGARLTGAMRLIGLDNFGGCVVFNDHSSNEIARITAQNAILYGVQRSSWLTSYCWAWPNSMLNTPEFPVHQHGYQCQRADKCRSIKAWPWIEKNLRVCWSSRDNTNCGKCLKCVRTAFGFMASGITPPACIGLPTSHIVEALDPEEDMVRTVAHLQTIARNRKARPEWIELMGILPAKAKRHGLTFDKNA